MSQLREILNNSYSDFNNNDNATEKKLTKSDHLQVEHRAKVLIQRFNRNPLLEDVSFYYKTCYALSEAKVEEFAELAEAKGRNPARYFSWLVSKECGWGSFKDD